MLSCGMSNSDPISPPAVLLCGHGSRSPEAAQEFNGLVEKIQRQLPQQRVVGAFLEFNQPAILDGLRDLYDQSPRSRTGPNNGNGTTRHPIYLREGEYFMCGDNSPQSKDSRLWVRDEISPYLQGRGDDYQLGTVPEDQLIGRAFFVYWPSALRPFGPDGPSVVPNVGRMRLIR